MMDYLETSNQRSRHTVVEIAPVRGDAQYQLFGAGGGLTAYVSYLFTPNRAAGRALYCWGCGPYGSFACDHVAAVRTHRTRGDADPTWASAFCGECGSGLAPAQAADPDRFGRPRCRRHAAAVREKKP